MKKYFILPLVLLVVSCSSKKKLEGVRSNIIMYEEESIKLDNTPVEIDSAKANDSSVQPFYNSEHCYSPLKISNNFHEIWSKKLDFESSPVLRSTSSPVIANGILYCIDAGGIVYALDAKNGKTIWRQSSTIIGKDGQVGGALAYDNGILIVNTSFAESIGFDAKTGKIIWRIKLPSPAKGDAITIYDGKAFMLCANSSLIVVDVKTGKILWRHFGIVSDTNYMGSASVAVDDNTVYVVYPSGEVFALLVENGSELWESMLSNTSLTSIAKTYIHPRACPVIKDEILYVVTANGQTVAFNSQTGEQIWSKNCGSVQTPIVSGNSIFICNSNSELICLNRFNGNQKWITKLDTDINLISDWYGELLLDKQILTISPHGKLNIIDLTGKILKSKMLTNSKNSISLNPVIANGIMYIQENNGRIVAYK